MSFVQARTIRGRHRGVGGFSAFTLPSGSPLQSALAPSLVANASPAVQQQIESTVRENIAASTPPPLAVDRAPTSPTECGCYLQSVADFAETAGVPLSASEFAALEAQCSAGVARFATFLGEQGVNYEGCKPWYQRRLTWYVGGGLALLGFAWWVLR